MPGKGPAKGGIMLSPKFLEWAKGQGLDKQLAAVTDAVKRYKTDQTQASNYAQLEPEKRSELIETYTQRLAQLQALEAPEAATPDS